MSPNAAPDREEATPADAAVRAVPDLDDPVAAALMRLEASREGLRRIMIPPKRPARRAAATGSAADAAGGEGPGLSQWLPGRWQDALEAASAWLRQHPVSALVVDGVQDWWRQHPLRHAAMMAGEEVSAVASPLIRRHPVAAVGIAATIGALVVVGRPWRWRAFGGSEQPLSRRMMRWLSSQIPTQAALGALMALVLDQARQAAAAQPETVRKEAAAGKTPPAPSGSEPPPAAPMPAAPSAGPDGAGL